MHDRRDFLKRSGGLAAASWMLLNSAACRDAAEEAARARADGTPPSVLTPEEMATLEAAADRIFPPDGDAPGAAALGAGVFMDRFLAYNQGMLEGARGAVGMLDGSAGDAGFAGLSPEGRDEALRTLESDAPGLFGLLRVLSLAAVLSDPRWGGNRDGAGWAAVGFDPQMAWQPPFGWYDAGHHSTEGGA